ncbi:hypothetical protein MO867_01915 [Microbulbifer sp. OS29]|uniref:Uncharacterized protein n=1 Tax=Microbulbifer okhotskensis TaxID=2926617 RepID=A0A9X2EK03_9GAMM|nr:hypothetical protein [Microbulbifer okhotskensis]MCO1333086.1 hypothetical protein [Microbulbifer okhotskensis]
MTLEKLTQANNPEFLWTGLEQYLKTSFWHKSQVPFLLVGLCPKYSDMNYIFLPGRTAVFPSGRRYSPEELDPDRWSFETEPDPEYKEVEDAFERANSLWKSQELPLNMGGDYYLIQDCLKWAKTHDFDVPWLNWAIASKHLSEDLSPTPPSCDHPAKDPSHPDYAPELHAALEVWESLYLRGEKPEHLEHSPSSGYWLNKNRQEMGASQKTRITRVSNPGKNKNSGK